MIHAPKSEAGCHAHIIEDLRDDYRAWYIFCNMHGLGPSTPIRTLLADDSRVIRRAVGRLLSGNRQIDLVGLASTFQEAIHLIDVLKPHVIVVDLGLTTAVNGESRKLRQMSDALLVVISAANDEGTIAAARELGADVFVDKMKLFDDLIPAILEGGQGNEGRHDAF
jgi:DNA-binding NarL/FixJ family response regulator